VFCERINNRGHPYFEAIRNSGDMFASKIRLLAIKKVNNSCSFTPRGRRTCPCPVENKNVAFLVAGNGEVKR